MRKVRASIVFVLAFLVVAYAVLQYGFYHPKYAGLVQFKLQSPDFHLTPWVYFLYVHIVTGCLTLIIAPFQLFRKQRNDKSKRLHRAMGMIYALSVLISGLVNIYLSLFASGGWLAGTGFFVMDVLWMYSTAMGIYSIVNKRIEEHKNWMLRSCALTFGAVTLRLYQIPLMIIFDGFTEPAYRLVAWLSWIPNLLIVEWIIRRRNRAGAQPARYRTLLPFSQEVEKSGLRQSVSSGNTAASRERTHVEVLRRNK